MSERSRHFRRAAIAITTATLLLATAAPLHAEPGADTGWLDSLMSADVPNGLAKGFDVVVLRPIGFVSLLVGAGLFVPAAILAAPDGRDSILAAREVFIDVAAQEVFQRPLGEF